MAYAIVRTDLMSGTKQPADLVSIKYQVSSVDTAIENGNVALVGALGTGECEVYLASAPTATSALEDVVLVATPELNYDERDKEFLNYLSSKLALDEFLFLLCDVRLIQSTYVRPIFFRSQHELFLVVYIPGIHSYHASTPCYVTH